MLPQVVKTMVSHSGVMLLSVLSSLVLIPLLMTTYGKDGLGSYWLILSIISVLGFLEFGLLTSSSTFFAKARGGGLGRLWVSTDRLIKRYVVILLLILALVASLVYIVWIGERAGIQADWLDDAQYLFVALIVSLALSIITIPFAAKLQAFEQIQVLYFAQFLNVLFRLVISLIVVYLEYSLWLLGLAALLATCVSSMYQIYFARKITNTPSQKHGDTLSWKKMFMVMLPISVLMLGDLLRFTVDTMIVGAVLGTTMVAVYGVGFLPAEFLKQAMSPFSRFFMVWASLDDGKREKNHDRLFQFAKYAGIPIAIMCALIAASAPLLIQAWMGEEFVAEAAVVLPVLLLGFVFALPQAGVTGHLIGAGQQWNLAWLTLAEGICNVLLTLFLIAEWGLLGVAIGTCIPMVLSKGFIQPWLLAKLHDLSYFYVWRHLLLAPLLWGAGVFVILVWPAWHVNHLWEYVAFGCLAFVVAGVPILYRGYMVWKVKHG